MVAVNGKCEENYYLKDSYCYKDCKDLPFSTETAGYYLLYIKINLIFFI
jgi:hypothetical protein